MGAGTFIGHLCALLGVAVLALALSSQQNRRALFPRALQASLFIIALIYCFLALRSVWITDERFGTHLQISYGFLASFAVSGLWYVQPTRPLSLLTRLGASFVMVPMLAHTFLTFAHQAGWVTGLDVFFWTGRGSELLGFVALALAPLWLRDEHTSALSAGKRIAAVATSLLVFSGVAALVLFRFDLTSALFLQGVRLQMPSIESYFGKGYLLLMALALAGAASSIVTQVWCRGAHRLIGYGLFLTLVAGYPSSYAGASAISLCGLMCVSVGLKRRGGDGEALPSTQDDEGDAESDGQDEVHQSEDKADPIT